VATPDAFVVAVVAANVPAVGLLAAKVTATPDIRLLDASRTVALTLTGVLVSTDVILGVVVPEAVKVTAIVEGVAVPEPPPLPGPPVPGIGLVSFTLHAASINNMKAKTDVDNLNRFIRQSLFKFTFKKNIKPSELSAYSLSYASYKILNRKKAFTYPKQLASFC
jgi:hypothetical protein